MAYDQRSEQRSSEQTEIKSPYSTACRKLRYFSSTDLPSRLIYIMLTKALDERLASACRSLDECIGFDERKGTNHKEPIAPIDDAGENWYLELTGYSRNTKKDGIGRGYEVLARSAA